MQALDYALKAREEQQAAQGTASIGTGDCAFDTSAKRLSLPPATAVKRQAVAKPAVAVVPGKHHAQVKPTHVQVKPNQKRKPAAPQQQEQQQQMLKRQKTVYNEFSTSTEDTTDSDCTMPSLGLKDDISSPPVPLLSVDKQHHPQAVTMPISGESANVVNRQAPAAQVNAATAVRTLSAQNPSLEEPLSLFRVSMHAGKGSQQMTPALPPVAHPAAQRTTPRRGKDGVHSPAHAAALPASKPSQPQTAAALTKPPQQTVPVIVDRPRGHAKPSSFADLLEAVLSQLDYEPTMGYGQEQEVHPALPAKLDLATPQGMSPLLLWLAVVTGRWWYHTVD